MEKIFDIIREELRDLTNQLNSARKACFNGSILLKTSDDWDRNFRRYDELCQRKFQMDQLIERIHNAGLEI